MNARKAFASFVAVAALSVSLASAASAGPPESHGYVGCYYAYDDQTEPARALSAEGWWTKKAIAAEKRMNAAFDSCVKGPISFVETDPQIA